jgi:hypothetical protein
MKRITIIVLALAIASGAVTALDAEAGIFSKKKSKRTEKPEWMKKPQRYENMPAMSFHSGVLQQDGWTGWKLGELKLQFAKDCQITTAGTDEGYLDAGRQAFVMGPQVGDTIVAWNVRVSATTLATTDGHQPHVQAKKSESNPNCGEIVRAPQ